MASMASPGYSPWGFPQTISRFPGDLCFGLHLVIVQEGLSMPPTSRGLEGASPDCPQTSTLPTAQHASGDFWHPEVTLWDQKAGPHPISAGQGVLGGGCCKGQLAEGQQRACKTPSTGECKIRCYFAKTGHFLDVKALHPDLGKVLLQPGHGAGSGTPGSMGWEAAHKCSPRSAPKNPDRGVTLEGCSKFSIWGGGVLGGGGGGWSPAIFYSRCIPKILVKCNIKLWKFSRGKAFLPLTWPANQKGAPHLPHFWQLFSNRAQLKFPKS